MTKDNESKKALELVKQAISDRRTVFEAITLLKEDATPEPVMVEAETRTGHYCQMMVDPREIAPIILKYDYPIYKVLEEEPPQRMWYELAEKLGVDVVTSFDL